MEVCPVTTKVVMPQLADIATNILAASDVT